MPIFTPADHQLFADCGYVVARGLVPRALLRPAIDALCAFYGMDYEDASTWRRAPPNSNGIVPVHQAQAFWDTRQHPAVHAAFAELLGTPRLWVSMDRGSFKPPVDASHPEPRDSRVHWDFEPWHPSPLKLQGVLYLDDTPLEGGGFRCVPAIYREVGEWIPRQAQARDPRRPEIGGRKVVRVAGGAGDLVIWTSALPHGSGVNRSSRPRVAQYIGMDFIGDQADRQERVECWRTKQAPLPWRSWPADVGPEPGPPAQLTALGRRLLGLDPW
ncbi:MAG TPA: phytanoyl-CoA dioxygenase family protein [Myxococcales bacterium]|nr:phytanoyl-CoA dioxygenase family protein [Myxococcales bacterium]